jgi:hypothetical protein
MDLIGIAPLGTSYPGAFYLLRSHHLYFHFAKFKQGIS